MAKSLQETIEEQNELLRRQEYRAEKEREEREREREREQEEREREKRRADAEQDYLAALPTCKYCGERIDYSASGSPAIFEYCCKKCAIADLGKEQFADYEVLGYYRLAKELDELIARNGGPLKIRLLANGMESFSVGQCFVVAQAYDTETEVLERNSAKTEECLRFMLTRSCHPELLMPIVLMCARRPVIFQSVLPDLIYSYLSKCDDRIDDVFTVEQQEQLWDYMARRKWVWFMEKFPAFAKLLWMNLFLRHSDARKKREMTQKVMKEVAARSYPLALAGSYYIYRDNLQNDEFNNKFLDYFSGFSHEDLNMFAQKIPDGTLKEILGLVDKKAHSENYMSRLLTTIFFGSIVWAYFQGSWGPLLAILLIPFAVLIANSFYNQKIRNRLGMNWISPLPSILAMLFCLPTGIFSLVYAVQANDFAGRGDIAEAKKAAANAKFCFWSSFVLGLFFVIFIFFLKVRFGHNKLEGCEFVVDGRV